MGLIRFWSKVGVKLSRIIDEMSVIDVYNFDTNDLRSVTVFSASTKKIVLSTIIFFFKDLLGYFYTYKEVQQQVYTKKIEASNNMHSKDLTTKKLNLSVTSNGQHHTTIYLLISKLE